MKKNFKLTYSNNTIWNLAEDMYEYIDRLINKQIGYVIEDNCIEFIGWDNYNNKFELTIDFKEKDLKKIQKLVYDYCKEWNKN